LNTAGGRGGAIANLGTLTLDRDVYYASIARNTAPSGTSILGESVTAKKRPDRCRYARGTLCRI
jgi:predicted outer membrane repeat protein